MALDSVMRWAGEIGAASSQTGTPRDVIAAIMQIESGGRPDALSPQGAIGLMQVMPFHFAAGQDPWDPATNILVGAQVLQDGYQRCGSWDGAAGAYFTGSCGTTSGGTDVFGTTAAIYIGKFDAALVGYQGAFDTTAGTLAGGPTQTGPTLSSVPVALLVVAVAAAFILLND